jgi:hypothetical protein
MQTTENNKNNSWAFGSIFVRISSYLSNITLLSMLPYPITSLDHFEHVRVFLNIFVKEIIVCY